MKHKMICLLTALAVLTAVLAGCAAGEQESAGSSQTAEDTAVLTGTLDEVKDFMFVVTDGEGNSYAFPIQDKKPEGLEEIQVGEQVTVTYTGQLSVVDSFTGEVIRVERAS